MTISKPSFPWDGILNGGTLTITSTTITGRSYIAVENDGGLVTILNSTVARNASGGVVNRRGGTTLLKNSILGYNNMPYDINCEGEVRSEGHNIITNTRDCRIDLQPSDMVTDPRFGDFLDDADPGPRGLRVFSLALR